MSCKRKNTEYYWQRVKFEAIKMAGRQFVQGKAGAFRAMSSCVVFALSSTPPPFLSPGCSAAVLPPLDHTTVVGEKESEETVKTVIFLPAASISLFWKSHPRTAFPVVKTEHFCLFPCLLRSHEPVTGERTPDGNEKLGRALVNVTSWADWPKPGSYKQWSLLWSALFRGLLPKGNWGGSVCPFVGLLSSGLLQQGKEDVGHGDRPGASSIKFSLQPNHSSSSDCSSPFHNF